MPDDAPAAFIRVPTRTLKKLVRFMKEIGEPGAANEIAEFSADYLGEANTEREAIVAKAKRLYASDEINIDSDAGLIETDGGCWVMAWVFVPMEDEDEDDADDSQDQAESEEADPVTE